MSKKVYLRALLLLIFQILFLLNLSCSKLPSPPSVWVCTPLFEENVCYCVLNDDKEKSKEIPIEKCKIAFEPSEWVKVTEYIKKLKLAIEKQCR